MPKKITIAALAFLLSAVFLQAQVPSPLIFSRVSKKDGLASNTTFQTVRDQQGYLWVSTQNGLQRYDANRFLTFRHIPGNTSSIPENTVNRLYLDSKGRLWLLFNKKIGIFNTMNFTFTETNIKSPVNILRKIMEDGQGRVVLFADNKQFLYDEAKKTFDALYPLPALPAGYSISDMAIDHTAGLYWFTGKQGSFFYDPEKKQFNTHELHNITDPLLDSLTQIKNSRYPFIAKDGTYWMVSWQPFSTTPPVLYRYDKNNHQLQRFEKIRAYKTTETYYEIWGIFQQSNGTTWIYGMGLLAYYNKEQNRFIHISSSPFEQNGIDYDMATNLYEDKEKNVWVSSNKGLYRFNVEAQVFSNIPNKRFNDTTSIPNVVSTIVETQQNGIWVATWGGGILSYNKQLQPIANPVTTADPLNKSLHASYMIERRNAEVWIGTQTGVLKIYDPVTSQCYSVTPPLLKGETITQLLEDRSGNIWIGSTSGLLVECNNGNWKDTLHAYSTVLSDAGDIMKLYEDHQGRLWIGTATEGLYEMNPANGHITRQFKKNADTNSGLLNDGATDILQYNDSTFLIASDGLCILNSRTNNFSYLTAADGIPAEHITSLIIDKKNRLWVACDGGLYRLNIYNKLYVTYSVADGITNDVFQGSAAALLNDGRIAIGTAHDFVVFDPDKTIDTTDAPAVHITGFALGNTNLSVDSILRLQELVLPYDNTFMRIELSTLHFRDYNSIHYMLEGLDKSWKEAYNNEITYQYLPPGDYTLMLRSENGETTELKNITRLKIHVNPPFWKTWWFYSLLLLLTGAALFWLDHERIKRKTAVFKMRSNIADGLYQDINAALGNITILSEMAKMKAGREPEKSKEFIEQIHTKSQNMALAMDDILWSIDPNNDSIDNFMLRFREYVDMLKSRNNVQIDVLVDKKTAGLQLKMKMRSDVFWLFRGGITNVVKTGAGNCRIHITYEKPELIYTLEFDTGNIDLQALNILRQRNELSDKLEELNARLEFKEHTANAVFILSIPVKNNGL